ncbi:MAG: protein-glutamate O-methyltransferase CheR [Gemmatimonadota bacterium]|nr:protein-glutamate O-methyltransferase CheR [Gemmatimonadota bacterium]
MITPEDYAYLGTLLRTKSGLALGLGKEYLLESRLPPVAKTFGFGSVGELVATLRAGPHQQLVKAVCDAMTTGETFFFRDTVPFELLRTAIFPELADRCRRGGRALRIWSAAASTGQEAYSIAMLIGDMGVQMSGVRVEIVATDFASHALNRARRGVYTQIEVQRGLPERFLRQFFVSTPDGFRLADDVRKRVAFRELNLLESFRSLGQFDIVLCRNVLIYFDSLTKKDVLERLSTALSPGGYLFLGATETAFGLTDRLVRLPDVPTSLHVRREDLEAVAEKLRVSGPAASVA